MRALRASGRFTAAGKPPWLFDASRSLRVLQLDLQVGSEFAGYRLESVAGRGGMGVVFRARNLITEQERALKVIAPQLSADARFRERFKRESRLAARLDHPNVIPIYEAREEQGLLYLVMPFVAGSDLGAVLKRERVTPARFIPIIRQVAAALDAAHDAGLVHRDVKPANVLLASGSEEHDVFLTDFGLVKDLASESSFTEAGAVMGTYHYAAPEQLDPGGGQPVDHRADIYALGCLIYHALAGQVPFPRESAGAIVAAHLFMEPPDIRSVRGDLPHALSAVLRRAMAKDPAARFATAGQLALAVSVATSASGTAPDGDAPTAPRAVEKARGRVEKDRESGNRSTFEKPRRVRRAWIVAAALASVAGAVAAVVIAVGGDSEATRAPEATAPARDAAPEPSAPTAPDDQVNALGKIELQPSGGGSARGVVYLVESGGERHIVLQARLPALTTKQKIAAYEVWLYNSERDARSLGAQYTDAKGVLQGRAPLPNDFAKFRSVDVSRESFADQSAGHSGDSVLRGAFRDLEPGP